MKALFVLGIVFSLFTSNKQATIEGSCFMGVAGNKACHRHACSKMYPKYKEFKCVHKSAWGKDKCVGPGKPLKEKASYELYHKLDYECKQLIKNDHYLENLNLDALEELRQENAYSVNDLLMALAGGVAFGGASAMFFSKRK